jgi:hypothetical protein
MVSTLELNTSPPLGVSKVIEGFTILKAFWFCEVVEELLSDIRIIQFDDKAVGTIQSYDKSLAAVLAEIKLKVLPPLVEYSILIEVI